MLVQPDAAWASGRPPGSPAPPPPRPAPLDPELEARLRRQRAQLYGRDVRDKLAAWHQKHAARRQEQAEAQRQLWEQQRAARLARLAERHQQMQQQQENQQQRPPTAPRPAPPAAKPGAAAPPTLLRAVQPADAKLAAAPAGSAHRIPAGRGPQLQKAPLQLDRQQERQQALSRAASSVAPAASAEASSSSLAAEAAAADDPLAEAVAALLAAEGGGDPFSIINLFVEEQLELQRMAAARTSTGAGTASQPAICSACGAGRRAVLEGAPQQEPAGLHGAGDSASAASRRLPSPAALQAAAERPPASAAPDLQRQPGGAAGSAAPITAHARHRRSSSMLLPLQFDTVTAQLELLQPAATAPAALLEAASDSLRPGGVDVAAELQMASQPASAAVQAELGIGAAPWRPPTEQRPAADWLLAAEARPMAPHQSASKQLYVQQWLQGAGSPAASSAAYSADPHHEAPAAGELGGDPGSSTSVADSVQPKPPAAAGITAADASAAALPPPAPAAPPRSAGSRSGSAITSAQRPGAPTPPGSSSLPGGSGTLSGSAHPDSSPAVLLPQHGLQPATGEAAEPEEQQGMEPPSAEPAANSQTTAVELGLPLLRERPSSTWDGSTGSGSGALPEEVLSFGQLQAVAGAAWESPATAAAAVMAGEVAAPGGDEQESAPASSAAGSQASQPSSAAPAPATGLHAPQPEPPSEAAAQPQGGSQQQSEAYSSDWDSEVEFSYGEHPGGSPAAPAGPQMPPAAAAAQAATSRPTSPRLVPSPPAGSPPGSAASQRPRSPHHAALDDRYPGSPPASASSAGLQRLVPGASSRPLSPASQAGSRRGSADGAGSSRPGSPPGNAAGADAAAELAVEGEDTLLVHSTPSSSSGSGGGGAAMLPDGGGSPYSLLRIGTDPEEGGMAPAAAAAAAVGPASPGAAAGAAAGSPPGTPLVVSPADDGSCPGSARVEDGTVVQTETHVRAYLGEVMAYFWGQRAEAFAAGAAPPLELEGYLALERRRPPCGDPQHIFNKLLFDAANEALAVHYQQALASYTGRVAPRLVLLSPELVEARVVQRVLRWAGVGGGGGSGSGGMDPAAVLAEDAAEDERTLGQLAGALQADLAAAAAAAPASPGAAAVPEGAEAGSAGAFGEEGA